jgi:hypothetical protein
MKYITSVLNKTQGNTLKTDEQYKAGGKDEEEQWRG